MPNTVFYFLLLILDLLLTAACSPVHNISPRPPEAQTSRPITVMTFNIRIGAGLTAYGRNPWNLKDEITPDVTPVIAAIHAVDPDIIGLQEVLGEQQAAKIAAALQMNYAYIPHGIERYGIWWGVAILSRFPLDTAHAYEISYGRGNTRSMLITELSPFNKKIVCVCIHKDKDQTDGHALRTVMRKINSIREPVILMGDLNIKPEDDRHTILSSRLADTAKLAATPTAYFAIKKGTFPGRHRKKQGKRIDYILVDKDKFNILDAGLTARTYWNASDHLGYYATVELL
jgi:endonuclease/exonuclease/phosphatase family metal-dependent hydrolase